MAGSLSRAVALALVIKATPILFKYHDSAQTTISTMAFVPQPVPGCPLHIAGKRTASPMLDNRGFERHLQVPADAIDRGGKRNDKGGVELDLSPDLVSRERLGGCIGVLGTEWASDDMAKVTSELFDGGIRS
ncbi:hypothetical protein BU17DRAFT_70624 [Hysterangium stoloniferum]|nr:hypothetical protein BU17DRAFT_70624 [Hysterangium stoloniferum]